MKYFICFLCLILPVTICKAQFFEVDTLRYSGNINKKINLVILGDGYIQSEINKFVDDAESFTNALFNQTPFKEYENYFNTFIIKIISNESGVTHPGTATNIEEPKHAVSQIDNYFGSTFDAFDIHRLVVAENEAAIFAVLANNFPLYDQVIILANSAHYGGSGGFFPVATTESSSNEIAIHELGHSFANLADEYYAGDIFAREANNMTAESDSELVRWKNWNDDLGVGVYQHCCDGESTSWYRPHLNCKMRHINASFCPVCIEAIVEVIHGLTSSLESYSPGNILEASTFPIQLNLELAHPQPNTLYTEWYVNGNIIASNEDTLFIEFEDLERGENEVSVLIEDRSDFLRIDDYNDNHFEVVTWFINNKACNNTEEVSIINLPPVVSNNQPVFLSANPQGGTFSGMGVAFNVFNPSLALPGFHQITYTYVNEEDCSTEVNESVFVTTVFYNFVNYILGATSPKIISDLEIFEDNYQPIIVTDLYGRILFNANQWLNKGSQQFIIDVNDWPKGVYFIKIGHHTKHKKIYVY